MLNQGKTDALGALSTGRDNALGALDAGQTAGLSSLGAGYASARPEYEGAIARFDPWVNAGKGALSAYEGSIGLGGEAGHNAAVSQFREAPGYKYAVDQATDAVARKASALGALGSGNTMAAISDRAGNMADQGYGQWQDRLKGMSDTGFAGATAQAGLQRGLGDLGAQQGRDEASLYGQFAGQRAGVHSNAGAQEAGTHTNFANLGNSNIANLSNTVIGAGTGAMMAGQQAAQNRLSFGMQLGQLGMSALGGMGGIGGIGSMLGGLGGSGLGTTPGAGGLY